MRTTIVTAPAAEPITVDDAKKHLRRTDRHEDDYLTDLIVAARQYCEHKTRRAFITQTWDLTLDKFPWSDSPQRSETDIYRQAQIRIPRPPLQSITSMKYIDSAGDEQTRDAALYVADTASEPGRLYPAYGQYWPTIRNIENAVTIRFVAGYGDAASDVPGALKHVIKLIVAHWFQNREHVVIGSVPKELQKTVDSLLWMYRLYEVA